MGTEQIVSLLIGERDRLNAAIEALQGGPVDTTPDAPKPAAKNAPAKKKGGMSAAGRKAIADATRKRWAALRAANMAPITSASALIGNVETKATSPVVTKKTTQAKKVAKGKAWTPAMKKAHTARMKVYWAAKRKAATKRK